MNNNVIIRKKVASIKETAKIAEDFANQLQEGDVVALCGELGTGKTFFVRKVAEALNYENLVTSPTFVILNIYKADMMIYHFDLYRLEREQELENVGFSEYLNKNGIVFVEWPEVAKNFLPAEYYLVKFKIVQDKRKSREIIIKKIEKKE
ncbi:MAG: tRNA (adenosine(37)-N6)-threonylcarbamoyltransferase complex ATPase subunit type 1 TsaE [Candidatus Cloacimonetes bacterium]|nr:tRNA (adenosine(37)-N6)-threonylcarbamoyltransferase complex ATPase subunit type 1 TsaE [Candidatus Cloacimonadota bacterium]MBS3766861.1 tRNA (adenosine(37)-N6)-threonylcarbamoyltransferase complex ATPase subunit type 1 TsaE [Candidatus Cloacimonadota bacterium]